MSFFLINLYGKRLLDVSGFPVFKSIMLLFINDRDFLVCSNGCNSDALNDIASKLSSWKKSTVFEISSSSMMLHDSTFDKV